MKEYISFVKRNIRDKPKDNGEPEEGVNEFEKEDAFL